MSWSCPLWTIVIKILTTVSRSGDSFESLIWLWSPLSGKLIRIFFSTSPKTLSLRCNSVSRVQRLDSSSTWGKMGVGNFHLNEQRPIEKWFSRWDLSPLSVPTSHVSLPFSSGLSTQPLSQGPAPESGRPRFKSWSCHSMCNLCQLP